MDIFEEAVMYCLAANGETFMAPQYNIGNGWSCPDFVALRPAKKIVYIVEVSTAGNLSGLVGKVKEKEQQWLSQLRSHLENRGVTDKSWTYRVLAFVRRDQLDWFKKAVDGIAAVFSVEDTIEHWLWDEKVYEADFLFAATDTEKLRRP